MIHFCTYFDKNYLIRGLTLFQSLRTHCPFFRLYTLCLDDDTFTVLKRLNLPRLIPISLQEIESWAPDLKKAKCNRSIIEYYFTLSPVLPLFVLDRYRKVNVITYVDADIFFYSSPEIIFKEFGGHSILVTEHRFPERLKYMEKKGRFNVQFQSFRRNKQGLACLNRWRAQCVEWCFDRVSGNKYADQKYLDEWPDLYDDLFILKHKGCGLGPWNWSGPGITIKGDQAFVDDTPLIFYHFHGMKILHSNLISLGMYRYGKMPPHVREWFYGRYTDNLKKTVAWLRASGIGRHGFTYQDIRSGHSFFRSLAESLIAGQLMYIR